MYDENTEILKTIRFAYPSLTKKELEVCRQVTIEMWQLWVAAGLRGHLREQLKKVLVDKLSDIEEKQTKFEEKQAKFNDLVNDLRSFLEKR